MELYSVCAFSHSLAAGSNRTSNRLFCQYFAFITPYHDRHYGHGMGAAIGE
jgi:hypothetical protein